MRQEDIKAGICLILFSAGVFWYASRYAEIAINLYGPNFFPQLISVLIFICGILLIVNAVRGTAPKKGEWIDKKGFIRMAIAIGICVGYLLLMQVIGFAISSCIFLFTLMTFLRQRGVMKRIFSSVVVSVLVWGIFRYFLVIPMPTGIWEFTF